MEGGDPNIINKVLTETLKKMEIQKALILISNVNDGIRHLKNLAKKKQNEKLLEEINIFT